MDSVDVSHEIAAQRTQGRGTIPMADWDRAPWNRWTFQHIAEMVPCERVWRGDGTPSSLVVAPQDIWSLPYPDDPQLGTIGEYFASIETDGVLVLSANRIVAERYYNGLKPQTLHLSQSVAKSVTGAAAGVLVGRGLLDPDAPLTQYLPELANTAYQGATVRNVLDMTSGVRFVEDYTALDSHMAMMDVACGWKPYGEPEWPKDIWSLILSLKEKEAEHGESFRYRSIETDVLAFAMQAATGKSIAEIISDEIWAPMGAAEDGMLTVDSAGYGLACGGFNATLRDYARFAALYAHDGYGNGRQIIPSTWISDTHAGRNNLFGADYRYILPCGAYRNTFWIEKEGAPVIMARGVFGQLLYIDPDADFVAVVLSSWPDFVNPDRTKRTLAALRAIRSALQAS